jgi:hypothetical protein
MQNKRRLLPGLLAVKLDENVVFIRRRQCVSAVPKSRLAKNKEEIAVPHNTMSSLRTSYAPFTSLLLKLNLPAESAGRAVMDGNIPRMRVSHTFSFRLSPRLLQSSSNEDPDGR